MNAGSSQSEQVTAGLREVSIKLWWLKVIGYWKETRFLILEAMKMETEVKSNVSGTIAQVLVSAGDSVTVGQNLVEIV